MLLVGVVFQDSLEDKMSKILFSCWLQCEEHVTELWLGTSKAEGRGSSVTKLNLN